MRRPRLRMTETEVKKYLREKARACPKCGGHVTTVALSAGWYDECFDCGHRWNFTTPRGSRITREEYEERERAIYTPEMRGVAPETPSYDSGEEGIRIVAKKSKTVKVSKKSQAGSSEPKRILKHEVRDYMAAHPEADTADVIKALQPKWKGRKINPVTLNSWRSEFRRLGILKSAKSAKKTKPSKSTKKSKKSKKSGAVRVVR